MKHTILLITLVLTSCSLTPQEKATLESNLVKDGTAALSAGMATGSWQGAALGAGAQVVRNHAPVTAAKQPLAKPVQP